MYPPRFKVAVIRLSNDKNLKTDFKVILENNGVFVSDQVRNFPLTIRKSDKEIGSGKIQHTYIATLFIDVRCFCVVTILLCT